MFKNTTIYVGSYHIYPERRSKNDLKAHGFNVFNV